MRLSPISRSLRVSNSFTGLYGRVRSECAADDYNSAEVKYCKYYPFKDENLKLAQKNLTFIERSRDDFYFGHTDLYYEEMGEQLSFTEQEYDMYKQGNLADGRAAVVEDELYAKGLQIYMKPESLRRRQEQRELEEKQRIAERREKILSPIYGLLAIFGINKARKVN